ncbi:MAG: DUF1653 domain-containing protein [Candidatus Shapirobacteria bacterium]|nr:DUF1653 domain-containing protein [Candidatus Shapirobacteria bacterium]MDD3002686.1 DUF1653 domain-containing protein [Candidatus Shapirobacteria bacterium]MDD4382890.1 DUF1653 domain-containing protein [Candidatus Shapirobacteria bacterium]
MPQSDRQILLTKLEQAKTQIEIGTKYRHTKTGSQYLVLNLVIQEDTEEIRVIYQELNHQPAIIWSRSFDGPDGWIIPTEINREMVPRFTKII